MPLSTTKSGASELLFGTQITLCEILESAKITVSDVSKAEGLQIWGEGGLYSTVFFVPNCKFQKPEEGEWRELEENEENSCNVDVCLS